MESIDELNVLGIRKYVLFAFIGVASIGLYLTELPTPHLLYAGIVIVAGGIAGIIAARWDVSGYYRSWIDIFPIFAIGLILIWIGLDELYYLPLGAGCILGGLERVFLGSRRAMFYTTISLSFMLAAVSAYFTASLSVTAISVLGALWAVWEAINSRQSTSRNPTE